MSAVCIKIGKKIHPNLGMNLAAKELFEYINNSGDMNYIIDFSDVIFMSRTFCQEYLYQKFKTNKIIDSLSVFEKCLQLLKKILKDNWSFYYFQLKNHFLVKR